MKIPLIIPALMALAASSHGQNVTPIPNPTPTLEERKAAMMEKFRAMQAARQQAGPAASASRVQTSLTLDVKNLATGGKQKDNWRTEWGSYNADFSSKRSVECEITLFGQPATVQVVCCFYGDNTGVKELSSSCKPIEFTSPSRRSVVFSAEAEKNVTHLALAHEHHESGTSLKAWVIQAYIGDKLVAWKASDNGASLEAVAKTPMLNKITPAK